MPCTASQPPAGQRALARRRGQQRAQPIAALCVGGMVLARTTGDPALRTTLCVSARQQALLLAAN